MCYWVDALNDAQSYCWWLGRGLRRKLGGHRDGGFSKSVWPLVVNVQLQARVCGGASASCGRGGGQQFRAAGPGCQPGLSRSHAQQFSILPLQPCLPPRRPQCPAALPAWRRLWRTSARPWLRRRRRWQARAPATTAVATTAAATTGAMPTGATRTGEGGRHCTYHTRPQTGTLPSRRHGHIAAHCKQQLKMQFGLV